jgi:hypothetical protein
MSTSCSNCGEDHWSGYDVLWQLPSEGGAERDLMVRAPSRGCVNVAILHVYDKWLDASEARAMAKALLDAADAISNQARHDQEEGDEPTQAMSESYEEWVRRHVAIWFGAKE